jgi:hypothetical protein
MPRNVYFSQGRTSEQRLYEDITIEALKIYGHDVYYIPRTIVNQDAIFNEATLSRFGESFMIEMYVENTDGFEGEGDLLSKFGVEVRDSLTLVLSTRRWEQLVGRFQTVAESRPQEGDLIYFPLVKGLFEIKFVEDESPFYQLQNLPTFKLSCETFAYSQEEIDTGITPIDDIELAYSNTTTLNLSSSNPWWYREAEELDPPGFTNNGGGGTILTPSIIAFEGYTGFFKDETITQRDRTNADFVLTVYNRTVGDSNLAITVGGNWTATNTKHNDKRVWEHTGSGGQKWYMWWATGFDVVDDNDSRWVIQGSDDPNVDALDLKSAPSVSDHSDNIYFTYEPNASRQNLGEVADHPDAQFEVHGSTFEDASTNVNQISFRNDELFRPVGQLNIDLNANDPNGNGFQNTIFAIPTSFSNETVTTAEVAKYDSETGATGLKVVDIVSTNNRTGETIPNGGFAVGINKMPIEASEGRVRVIETLSGTSGEQTLYTKSYVIASSSSTGTLATSDSDVFADNPEIETTGNNFIDFTESNPFGEPNITT